MNATLQPKLTMGGLALVLVLCLMQTCNSCSTSTQLSKLTRRIDALDSTTATVATEAETERIIKTEGLRISKRNLYDQNAIVRTAIRPDDRMNEYDAEIDSIQGNR